jgi:hypothetical protein
MEPPNQHGRPVREARVAHLLGGLRSRCGGDTSASLNLVGVDENLFDWQLRSPNEFFGWLRWLGLTLVGTDTALIQSARPDLEPPLWQSYSAAIGKKRSSLPTRLLWSDLANGSYEASNLSLHDLSARIHFHLQAVDWRLRALSESYGRELSNLVENHKFEHGERQYTGHTEAIFLALHAFMVEACVLRDYLAEYVASVTQTTLANGSPIRRMSKLRPVLSSLASTYSKLGEELSAATDPTTPGWLAVLGAYRDLVIHSGPLAMVSHGIYSRGRYVETAAGIGVPIIELPLPECPADLAKLRARGQHLRGSADWIEKTWASSVAGTEDVDALAYCASVVEKLTDLSERLIPLSPVSPKPLQLVSKGPGGSMVSRRR